jgi:AcrR family transcriptional regulator
MPVKVERKRYRSELREAAVDEMRARIVAAALRVLAGGEGVPAFSLDATAREAGVTRLTVYNRFGSKLGLLEAVFDDVARKGGLMDLPSVFAEADAREALRRFVSVFCRFWASHGTMLPRFSAIARLDDEIAQSLKQRTERRRHALATLVRRLSPRSHRAELVDVLFALTSFEFFDALCVGGRSGKKVEALVQKLVDDAVSDSRRDKVRRAKSDRSPLPK